MPAILHPTSDHRTLQFTAEFDCSVPTRVVTYNHRRAARKCPPSQKAPFSIRVGPLDVRRLRLSSAASPQNSQLRVIAAWEAPGAARGGGLRGAAAPGPINVT